MSDLGEPWVTKCRRGKHLGHERGRAMTVRRFHHTTNTTTRTVAQRRRVHAARLRTAEMRARMAAPDSADAGRRVGEKS